MQTAQPFAISTEPRSPIALLADVSSLLSRQTADRIAEEDSAWSRAPAHLRCVDAGNRCLVVTRSGVAKPVPLLELTPAELDLFAASV